MKQLIMFFSFCIYLFAGQDFLEPSQAFKTKLYEEKNNITFELTLGKDIYIYHDKLKVVITTPKKVDITEDVDIQKPVEYHDFLVHFNGIKLIVPKELIVSSVGDTLYEIEFQYQGCSKKGLCYQPMKENIKSIDKKIVKKDISKPAKSETDTIAQTLKEGNVFWILATFFGFGLLLALTPCVFPMIPILSSIIVSHSAKGKQMSASKGLWLSIIYILSMSAAYTIAGVLAGLFGANLQAAMQNPVILTIFAGIFVALAFSMFGYYKLELPQSWQNKLNKNAQKGEKKKGWVGIAIMGFLSALIVGPCVAPPLAGALMYIGQTGDALLGGASLFVMSIGMGVPLLVVGAGAGKFMPRPGGWMDTVSKVFGVVMLGVAIWMIERIIPAMATMILWSLLFIGSALYLFLKKGVLLKILAIIFFAYGFILVLGAGSGAENPLNPLEYIGDSKIKKDGLVFKKIKSVEELEKIVKSAKRPIMLDFYADWCVSCKELEHTTFKDQRVIDALKGFVVLKVDTTSNSENDKALLKKFNLFGPPGIIFWDKNGSEIKEAKLVGYKNGDEFLSHIKRFYL